MALFSNISYAYLLRIDICLYFLYIDLEISILCCNLYCPMFLIWFIQTGKSQLYVINTVIQTLHITELHIYSQNKNLKTPQNTRLIMRYTKPVFRKFRSNLTVKTNKESSGGCSTRDSARFYQIRLTLCIFGLENP